MISKNMTFVIKKFTPQLNGHSSMELFYPNEVYNKCLMFSSDPKRSHNSKDRKMSISSPVIFMA